MPTLDFGPAGGPGDICSACDRALLTVTASAMAWRVPTPTEKEAIARVATRHAGNSTVHLSRVRVSTVGPWASATAAIYVGTAPPNYATYIFHKVHGRWTNAGAGTSGEWCVMPRQDQKNLGFPASCPCTPSAEAIMFSPIAYGISCHMVDDGTFSGS